MKSNKKKAKQPIEEVGDSEDGAESDLVESDDEDDEEGELMDDEEGERADEQGGARQRSRS